MSKKFLVFLIAIFLIAGGIYFSPYFERKSPNITINSNGYWNLRTPLKIEITDNTGIKYYKIEIKSYIIEKHLTNPEKKIVVSLKLPKNYPLDNGKQILKVCANDISKWNFFKGNISKKEIPLIIDKKNPVITSLSNSYGIGRGGSGLVIYKIDEKNLKKNYVIVNNSHKFKSFPYKKNGYYIVLIAWPVKEKNFKSVIVAIDKANNITKRKINFFIKDYKYKTSKINLTQSFLDGKVKDILEETGEPISDDYIERFKQMNEILRDKNESLIENISRKFNTSKIEKFKIYPFRPLKNAAKMASFGDHRFYYFNGKQISESWHLGLDLASLKHAPIKLSNNGTVLYTDFTGIYGNVIIVYHGLGLSSLYAHCSQVFVNKGEKVKKGKIIGKTGNTGAVFGDHLHFGILIQGIEVQPLEWIDKHWIKDNIEKVIKEADFLIE